MNTRQNFTLRLALIADGAANSTTVQEVMRAISWLR